MNNDTHTNGKADAIALLNHYIALVQQEPIGYIAVVAAKEPATFYDGYAGTVELEKVAREGLKVVSEKIDKSILNRTMPDPDPNYDESYVSYNITESPLSYDFIPWLIDAEMTRIRANAPAPLKVGFWFGRDNKTGMNGPDRQSMLDNVVRPMLDLIGAVEDPNGTKGKFKHFFSLRDIVKAYKDGEQIPKFKSPLQEAIYEPGYVTITLREANHWPHRNSKIPEWIRFAEYLKKKGERVIFVRDTAKADEAIPGFDICPRASRDLHSRMKLYEDARCNLFAANGPVMLCVFSDKPWLKFIEIDEQGAYNAAKSDFWEQCIGVKVGSQFPWSSDKQRITWKSDYYTNLVLEWEALNV